MFRAFCWGGFVTSHLIGDFLLGFFGSNASDSC